MAQDVCQKVNSSNALKENRSTVYVTANGTAQIYTRDRAKTVSLQDWETKLSTKFDDPNYYSN